MIPKKKRRLKYKPLRTCTLCEGTGYWTSCMDITFKCDCYKETKAYKERRRSMKPNVIDDCEKCVRFKECYYVPRMDDGIWTGTRKFMKAASQRALCVNNDKKNFTRDD